MHFLDKAPSEGNFAGLISRAKNNLAQNVVPMAASREVSSVATKAPPAIPKTESELQWEQIEKKISRALKIGDMDFTDLTEVDEVNNQFSA